MLLWMTWLLLCFCFYSESVCIGLLGTERRQYEAQLHRSMVESGPVCFFLRALPRVAVGSFVRYSHTVLLQLATIIG
jgi:hypothetical protein